MLLSYSKAQRYSDKPLKSYYKGIGILFPGAGLGFLGTLAYERDISPNSSLDLSAIYIFIQGEYYSDFIKIIYPSYKFYLQTNNRFFRKFWVAPYLSYLHLNTHYYNGVHINGKYDNGFGGGFSFGRKTFFKKDGKVFVDIGLGLSVNTIIETDEINCTKTYEFPTYIPRFILLFGISN